MKLAYLGEAKTGGEPWAVAVLLIADPDRDWRAVNAAFTELRDTCLKPEDRAALLNPKEIFHGSGTFARHRYDFEDRIAVLEALADLPARLGLRLIAATLPAESATQEDARTAVLGQLDAGDETWAVVTEPGAGGLAPTPFGPPLMADKATSPLLQLADLAAFIVKRHAAGKEDTQELYERLTAAFD